MDFVSGTRVSTPSIWPSELSEVYYPLWESSPSSHKK
jgi:hypothetical protein